MLIAGCGDLGGRIAGRAQARKEEVVCLVRSAASAQRLDGRGLDARAQDLDSDIVLDDKSQRQAQVFYFAPPPAQGVDDPRMGRLLDALDTRPRRIVYVSTTGVYGDCRGERVDETRPPNPQVDRARRRFDAEQRLLRWRDTHAGEVVILRVAGIYGPDKLPLQRLRDRVPMIAEVDAPWTNRIHIDDLVRVAEAAMARGIDGEVYNVSDGSPGNMRDYFDRIADAFDLPRAPEITLADAGDRLSPGMLSYLAESRRLDNRKMLDTFGLALTYPDLASGLQACVDVMRTESVD
ncbi:MAG: SDR family oxidoreductase [Gammaproteobacteria bacterium]|nr:SDR family oxidoreductase [Gammaproteobacteria bacterium]